MKLEEKIVTVILVTALIIFSIQYFRKILSTNFNWFKIPTPHELYFLSYDKEAGDYIEFEVFSSCNSICQMKVCEYEKEVSLKRGITSFNLRVEGCDKFNNVVNISCGNAFILFYFNKTHVPKKKKVEFNFIDLERKNGIFELKVNGTYNFSISSYLPIQIFVGGEKIYSPIYFFGRGNKTFEIRERISIPKEGKVEVKILDKRIGTSVELEKHYPIDLFLLLILSFLLSLILFRKFRIDLIQFFLIFFSLIVVLFVLQFQLYNNFGFHRFLLSSIIFGLILLSSKLKKRRRNLKFKKEVKVEAIIFSLIFTFYTLLLKILIGPFDVWWPYYSRNTQNTFLHKTTFFVDELSYLGRNFTYPPAFFEFGAQVTQLIGSRSFYSIQTPLHIFIVFVFSLTSYLIFFNLDKRRKRVIASLCLTSLVFTFLTSVAGTLHTFSFALMNISVIFFLLGDFFKIFSIFTLAIATSTHPISLPMFISFGLLSKKLKKNYLFELMKIAILSVSISLIFYLPIFLRYGLPYEIVPRRWGYFITFGMPGLFFDYQYLLPLALVGIIIGLGRKKILQSLFLLILIFANIYLSYRINVIFSIVLSFLLVEFLDKYLENSIIFSLVLFPLLLNFIISAIIYSGVKDWCVWGSINEMCTSAMKFLDSIFQQKKVLLLILNMLI